MRVEDLDKSRFPAGWVLVQGLDGKWFAHCGRSQFWHRTRSWEKLHEEAMVEEASLKVWDGECKCL